MGDYLSKPSQSNPSSTAGPMTSSNSSETHQPKPETEPIRQPKIPEPKSPIQETKENPAEKEALSEKVSEEWIEEKNSDEEVKEEEEGECGFCLFMKAGGCRETFTDWEKCVEEGEKNKEDIVEKCFQATSALKKCMEAHSDYYAPLLQAEEEAVRQLEEEKERLSHAGDESGKKENEEILDDSEKKETT